MKSLPQILTRSKAAVAVLALMGASLAACATDAVLRRRTSIAVSSRCTTSTSEALTPPSWRYQQAHPEDPMGHVSNAAAYLFSEFDRLHILEADLFTDDHKFDNRSKLTPDPASEDPVRE